MSGDNYKPAQVGQPLRIPAATYNALLNMLQEWRKDAQSFDSDPLEFEFDNTIVYVRNDTGNDLNRFNVIRLGEAVIKPQDNLTEFQSRAVLAALKPDATKQDAIAITLEPIASGSIGRAAVTGIVRVKLYVEGSLYGWADVKTDVVDYMIPAPGGRVETLYVQEPEEGVDPQWRWAIVRLDQSSLEAIVLLKGKRDDNGYYEAEVQVYDVERKGWITQYECRALDLDKDMCGSGMRPRIRVIGRYLGFDPDSKKPLFGFGCCCTGYGSGSGG
jgi:hypothetical protein